MVTFIEIISGSKEGIKYRLYEGATLGRSNADILIDDPKISGTHARVEKNNRNQLVLIDQDSANGVFINDRRVKKVTLIPGVTFELGRTLFRVSQEMAEVEEVIQKTLTWQDNAKESISGMDIRNKKGPLKIYRFDPAVHLHFLQGIQAGTEVILGYGPRTAGWGSLDIELLDEKSPEVAFEIFPGADGFAQVKVPQGDVVKINNASQESGSLQSGDMISIGQTLIRISYLD